MSQGLFINLGLMVGVVGFALLIAVSQVAAVATAAGLVLCVGLARRLERFPAVALMVIVALVPLSYLHTQVGFGVMNSLSKLVFFPAFAVLVLDWVLTRRPLVLGRAGFFVLLYGLTLALAYLCNERTPHSLWFLSRFASMILLFLLSANAIHEERDLAMITGVVVAACMVSAFGSLVGAVGAETADGGFTRLNGWSADDAPTFGTNMLVALLLGVYFLAATRKSWMRLVLAPVVVVLALAIIQTFARGVALVTLLSLGYLLFKLRRRISPVWVLAVIVVVALSLIAFVPAVYWERLASSVTRFGSDPTIGRRLDSYRIAYELFSRQPLLGFGPGNFIVEYMSPEFRFDHSATPSVCFNLYLSIAVQAGLIGLAAFGLIVVVAFRELRFVARSYGEGDGFLKQGAEVLEVILAAFLLVSLVEPTDLHKYMWIVFGLIAATARLRREQLAGAAVIPAGPG